MNRNGRAENEGKYTSVKKESWKAKIYLEWMVQEQGSLKGNIKGGIEPIWVVESFMTMIIYK